MPAVGVAVGVAAVRKARARDVRKAAVKAAPRRARMAARAASDRSAADIDVGFAL